MTKKKHKQHKKRPTLAQQLGIARVMSWEEREAFHKELLSYQLGIKPKDEFRQHLIDTIANDRRILKYQQERRKGWHLQGKSLDAISRFLKRKLTELPQKRINGLVNSLEKITKRQGMFRYNRNLLELYTEVRQSDMPMDKKTSILDNIADRATLHTLAKAKNISDKALTYFDFATEGRNLPIIDYKGDDSKIYLIFGAIDTDGGSLTFEFTRYLDGRIRNTPGGLRDLNDPEVQKQTQEMLAGSIGYCEKHIAEKREERRQYPHSFSFEYRSKVQSKDWNFRERQPSGEDPILLEQTDDDVMKILAEKYDGQVAEMKEHVFFNFHGRIKANKVLALKPGFLQSFDGMHPREVAEKLCNDIEDAYSTVTGPKGSTGESQVLEGRL